MIFIFSMSEYNHLITTNMVKIIEAVYENCVFKPLEEVNLKEKRVKN